MAFVCIGPAPYVFMIRLAEPIQLRSLAASGRRETEAVRNEYKRKVDNIERPSSTPGADSSQVRSILTSGETAG